LRRCGGLPAAADTGWQRDRSISHERLGDLAVAAGDLTAAATAHRASRDIRVRLAAADPTNTGWQRDLDFVRERIARLSEANLLDNALRHTPASGAVRVSARRDGPDAVIEVTDTGDGIPATDLDTIFGRFHRLDAARTRADGGTGLGLTIARAIVTAHHGTLIATSAGTGTGATLTVRLTARR
jgi:C4-dicarboxylate-specific signal transduction histidine kinase